MAKISKRGTGMVTAFLALSITLVSCGTAASSSAIESSSAVASAPPSPSTAESVTPEPASSPRTLTFQLNPLVGTAHGTMIVDITASGYTLMATMADLDPGSEHRIVFHGGACDDIDPHSLDELLGIGRADDNGDMTRLIEKPNFVWSIRSGGQVLAVHGNADSAGGYFTHIACAHLTD